MANKYGFVEQVGNVKLDYACYSGDNKYSDGDVENDILQIVQSGNIAEALRNDNRWPVVYHLSDVRKNLLSWYAFPSDASVLEIGMGCGAVTGAYAGKVASVDGVELSARRAQIAAWRNKAYHNITIHVGNLNDMDFQKQFDFVTLIGVLEYAGSFTKGKDPYFSFLQQCKKYLKPGGTLIVAIENRLGMKYFSGATEDHLGRQFVGLTDYQGVESVKTFSKPALNKLLTTAGFMEQDWYYPHPDYKLPDEILTDEMDFSQLGFRHAIESYDTDRYELFSERDALRSVAMDGLLGIFANSFLVFARRDF